MFTSQYTMCECGVSYNYLAHSSICGEWTIRIFWYLSYLRWVSIDFNCSVGHCVNFPFLSILSFTCLLSPVSYPLPPVSWRLLHCDCTSQPVSLHHQLQLCNKINSLWNKLEECNRNHSAHYRGNYSFYNCEITSEYSLLLEVNR